MENIHQPKNTDSATSPENREREALLFSEHFRSLGYEETSPLSLTPPEDDKTVAFTGSSINAFKGYLRDRTPIEKPAFIQQPCLRTHDITHAFDLGNIPFGMPFFHIDGTFNAPGSYMKTSQDAISYMADALGIDMNRILIKPTVPDDSEILLAPFRELGVPTETDASRYYVWKYGINEVHGKGVTIFLQHPNGSWWDVGNVVSIREQNENEIATEFGLGREFFLTALHGYRDPFEATLMHNTEAYTSDIHKKVLTYLEAAFTASSTLTDSKGRTTKMANRYIQAAHYLCEVHGYTPSDTERIAHKYAEIADVSFDPQLFISRYRNRHEIIAHIDSFIQNVFHNSVIWSPEYALKMIREYAQKNGIRAEEIKLFLSRQYPDNEPVRELTQKI